MDQKKIYTIFIASIIVVFLGVIVIGSKKPSNQMAISNRQSVDTSQNIPSNNPVFFYGNTCPHCADVEKWMEENDVEGRLTINKKEVYDNQQNAQELTQAAKACGLDTNNIGVPFLYADGTCFVGTPDVEKYLSTRAGISDSTQSAERRTK